MLKGRARNRRNSEKYQLQKITQSMRNDQKQVDQNKDFASRISVPPDMKPRQAVKVFFLDSDPEYGEIYSMEPNEPNPMVTVTLVGGDEEHAFKSLFDWDEYKKRWVLDYRN